MSFVINQDFKVACQFEIAQHIGKVEDKNTKNNIGLTPLQIAIGDYRNPEKDNGFQFANY